MSHLNGFHDVDVDVRPVDKCDVAVLVCFGSPSHLSWIRVLRVQREVY